MPQKFRNYSRLSARRGATEFFLFCIADLGRPARGTTVFLFYFSPTLPLGNKTKAVEVEPLLNPPFSLGGGGKRDAPRRVSASAEPCSLPRRRAGSCLLNGFIMALVASTPISLPFPRRTLMKRATEKPCCPASGAVALILNYWPSRCAVLAAVVKCRIGSTELQRKRKKETNKKSTMVIFFFLLRLFFFKHFFFFCSAAAHLSSPDPPTQAAH